jgi:hypothetical protein
MSESRLNTTTSLLRGKSAPLPNDYLQMVEQVFASNFDAGLKALAKLKAKSRFEAGGAVYPNEVILSVSLLQEGKLSATTAHASADFDPKASSPTVEDLLAACVDAVGSLFQLLLNPKQKDRIEAIASESLASLEDIPFQWTKVEVDNRKIFLKVDKSNLSLDKAADDWLAKNDPEAIAETEEEQRETEDLFFTGPKKKIRE